MAKKKKTRIRYERLIPFLLAVVLLLTGIGFLINKTVIIPGKLKKLGYTSQQVRVITRNKLTDEFLEFGESSLMRAALTASDKNIFERKAFLVKDSELPAEASVTYEYIANLNSKGYVMEDARDIVLNLTVQENELLRKSVFVREFPSLIKQEGFNLSMLPRYVIALRTGVSQMDTVVEFVNGNYDFIPGSSLDYASFYHDEKQVSDPDSYTVMTNKQYYLPSDYIPKDLVMPSCRYDSSFLRSEAASAFEKMSADAEAQGYDKLICQSNFRDYDDQQDIYNSYVSSYGKWKADSFVSRPGFSEHQTGLASDIGGNATGVEDLLDYVGYDWVMENSYKYGLIQRYPKGKEYITGFEFESWHFRYVGIEPAWIMYQNNWTLEEYRILFN